MYSFLFKNKILLYNTISCSLLCPWATRPLCSQPTCRPLMKPDESQVCSFWLDVSVQHYNASYFCLLNTFCVYSVRFGGISVLHLPNSTTFSVFHRAGWARTKPFLSDKQANLLPQRWQAICSEMSRGQHRGRDQSPSVWPQTACGAHALQARIHQRWPPSLHARSVRRRGVRHQSASDWVWDCCDGRCASY